MKYILSFFIFTSILMASSISVENQYVRTTPPGVKNSAGFMNVVNNSSKDILIVDVKSDIAKKVELHTHEMRNGVMRMYQLREIRVKANSNIEFKPGSFHVMFMGLKDSLKESQSVDFKLLLSNGEEINVTAPVKKVMSGMKHAR